MKTAVIMAILLISSLMYKCSEGEAEKVLAYQDGYTLTQENFKNYIESLERKKGVLSFTEKDNEQAKLLDFFYANPEGTLAEISEIIDTVTSDVSKQNASTITSDDDSLVTNSSKVQVNLAEGHREVRRLLNGDIGEMQFDTKAANTFRKYVASSLFTTTSSKASSGYNSSDYSSSKGQIQFCANGTFVEVLSGHLSIAIEGASAVSSGSDAMPGYWEAAALPNGMFIILMYSTHARMLEDSPNGFLPFVVTKHGPDFVQLPSGDLYRRTANQYCN